MARSATKKAEKASVVSCSSCGDPTPSTWRCPDCGRDAGGRCVECHQELKHGVIGAPPASKGRYPDYSKTMADDADAFRKEFDL